MRENKVHGASGGGGGGDEASVEQMRHQPPLNTFRGETQEQNEAAVEGH